MALWSEALGLEFHFDGADLQLRELAKQAYLRTLPESVQHLDITAARCAAEVRASREAEQRADDESRRADAAAQVGRAEEARLAANQGHVHSGIATGRVLHAVWGRGLSRSVVVGKLLG